MKKQYINPEVEIYTTELKDGVMLISSIEKGEPCGEGESVTADVKESVNEWEIDW